MISKDPDTALHLRILMATYGRRQDEIAAAVGIAPETLCRILAGTQRYTSEKTLRRIQDAILGREVSHA